MKINELKIGDKVRYKTDFSGKEVVDFGIISKLEDHAGYFGIKDIRGVANFTNAADKGGIHKKHIISKIIELGDNYKEVQIEKDDFQDIIESLMNLSILLEQKYKKKHSEKTTSKSFKFDISFVNRVEFDQSPHRPFSGEFPSCFFKIDGCQIKYHPDNMELKDFFGKEYTIEIKEKK